VDLFSTCTQIIRATECQANKALIVGLDSCFLITLDLITRTSYTLEFAMVCM